MATPDPQTVRELATEHILDAPGDDIGADVIGHFGPDALTKHEYSAWCSAIREAIRTATITVSWPDAATGIWDRQPIPDAADRAARRIRAVLAEHITNGRVSAPYYADDDVTAVLDDREQLAARLKNAEAQTERWFRQANRITGIIDHAYSMTTYVQPEEGDVPPTIQSVHQAVRAIVDEDRPTADANQLEVPDPAAWCWNRHPDHPLPCGRLAGHKPPHARGERRWTDAEEGGEPT